jgi:hypothetical protein
MVPVMVLRSLCAKAGIKIKAVLKNKNVTERMAVPPSGGIIIAGLPSRRKYIPRRGERQAIGRSSALNAVSSHHQH